MRWFSLQLKQKKNNKLINCAECTTFKFIKNTLSNAMFWAPVSTIV